tara:strand:- start:1806 stop:2084 length:279 start_codon:yes stop_codon:yes gene_type:complete
VSNNLPNNQSNDGWEGLDNSNIIKNEPSEIDTAFFKAFNTIDGQKVLNYLMHKTTNQPTWTPGNEPSYGYYREGQNSIIKEIQNKINRCKNG